jgi:hypothetical protein
MSSSPARVHELFTVEIDCGVDDLTSAMSRMREWLDTQRFEPDIFRHTVDGESITITVQFKVESEAIAFSRTFDGKLV